MGSILKAMGASGEEKKSGINSPWGWLTEPFTLFGIRFAPLWLPLERRLQTAAVLFWILLFTVSPSLTMFILYYTIAKTTYFKWVGILYTAWYIYDFDTCNKGGRRWSWMRKGFVSKGLAEYFPVKVVKTSELDPSRNYIMGSHPHGFICFGVLSAFGSDVHKTDKLFPGITFSLLSLREFYLAPGLRDFALAAGVSAASSKNIDHIVGNPKVKGQAAMIVVGGAREVLSIKENQVELVLANRKGFCKKALVHGADLVPSFSFNELSTGKLKMTGDSWFEVQFRKFQIWFLNKTRWPLIFMHGRGVFNYKYGLIPYRVPITVVVGKPIRVEQNAKPSQEEIDDLHKKYIAELKQLYYENNSKYGLSDNKLVFV